MNVKRFRDLFYTPEVIGKVIMDLNACEMLLGLILIRYYTAQERFSEFEDNIMSRFNLNTKIDILKNLKLPKQYKSKKKVISSLDKIKKVRNIMAHSYLPDEDPKFQKLLRDKDIDRIFQDYPKSFNKEIGDTKKRLQALYKVYLSTIKRNQSE